MVKYAWIEKHRQIYSTTMMCELLGVSRSGLNAARTRGTSKRARDDALLVEQLRHGQRKHRGRYGRRRMTPEVSQALGQAVNHKRVARLMREHGLQSHKRRRFRVVTTDSKHAYPLAPQPARAQLCGARAQPLVAGRYHLRAHRRRLAVRGVGAGTVRSQAGGLGD